MLRLLDDPRELVSRDGLIIPAQIIATLSYELNRIMLAKILNIAMLTFICWDIIITMDEEIKCMWGRKWDLVRILYCITRYSAPVVVGLCTFEIFYPAPSLKSCNILIRMNIVVGLIITSSSMLLLLLRVWAIWDRNLWILVPLLILFSCAEIVPTVLLGVKVHNLRAIHNPLPGILTGCIVPFNGQFQWFRLLVCSLVYESLLLALTIVRAWQSYQEGMQLPLLSYIVRDGIGYFLVVTVSILLTTIGALIPVTTPAAIGSAMFPGFMAVMCYRLILRLRSYSTNQAVISTSGDQGEDSIPEFAMADFVSTSPPSDRDQFTLLP